ncbi:MAG: glycosyltransferase family 2 protein [Clostridia bacterium]|nr:glycosyltransferase family 2 protein [Clostridia bacterium]
MLSIIIVNFNTSQLVLDCAESIKKYPPCCDYEIIVVDNDSRVEEKKLLENSDLKVIFSSTNDGFSKANNKGVEEASGDVLLFLNPDTVVLENALSDTLEFLKEHKDSGIVGCRVNLESGGLDMACKRSLPTVRNAVGHYLKLNGKIKYFSGYRRLDLADDYVGEVECVVGAFMMMPRSVFLKAGKFCEDYFMYGEDVELCRSVLNLGYKVYYFGKAEIIHKKRASSHKNKRAGKAFYDSMEIYYDKHKKNCLGDIFVKTGIRIARYLGL